MTDEELLHFCHDNKHLRIERDATGLLYIMAPTFTETGLYNNNISFELTLRNKRTSAGYVFDSSAGFKLPNGAMRSPDASWIAKSRWDNLPAEKKKGFSQICLDFVIELKSSSDSLEYLKNKIQDWIKGGCQVAWLIDLEEYRCTIFRQGHEPEMVLMPMDISTNDLLPGFVLTWKAIGI